MILQEQINQAIQVIIGCDFESTQRIFLERQRSELFLQSPAAEKPMGIEVSLFPIVVTKKMEEVCAILKHTRGSPSKTRIIANQIRDLNVNKALEVLEFMRQKLLIFQKTQFYFAPQIITFLRHSDSIE